MLLFPATPPGCGLEMQGTWGRTRTGTDYVRDAADVNDVLQSPDPRFVMGKVPERGAGSSAAGRPVLIKERGASSFFSCLLFPISLVCLVCFIVIFLD